MFLSLLPGRLKGPKSLENVSRHNELALAFKLSFSRKGKYGNKEQAN